MYCKAKINNPPKFGSLLIILAVLVSAMAVMFVLHAETDGSSAQAVGNDESDDPRGEINFSLDFDSGILTISGSGAMEDYTEGGTPWELYKSFIKSVVVGDSITYVGAYAFCNFTYLSSVDFGDSVSTIGPYAFSKCTDLESVTFKNVTKIEDHAFKDCTALSSVTFSGSTESLGEYAFEGCASLESVALPDSIETIANGLFYNCTALAEPTLPKNVRSIGDIAFSNCTSLASMTIPSSLEKIGYKAFLDCTSLKSVTILGDDTHLESGAFMNCTGLKDLAVPAGLNTVVSDDSPAFEGCVSIEKITFTGPGDWYAYKSSYIYTPWYLSRANLTAAVISDGVTSVGDHAFKDCTALGSVTFGGSVGSIGEYAFEGCTSLESVALPDSIETIANGLFYNCTGLVKLTFPKNVRSIGDIAFSNCASLASMTFPSSVEKIAYRAFRDCISLESVTILGDDTRLESGAFMNCTGLKDLTVPAGLNTVVSDDSPAFEGCVSIEKITFTGPGDWYAYKSSYIYTPWYLSRANLTDAVISDGVRSIGDHAFYGCEKLPSMNIPDSVTAVGDAAFSNCAALGSVTLPDTVTKIGNEVFSNCISLSALDLGESIGSIGDRAFYNCTELKSISLGKSLRSIGTSAFSNCVLLGSVTLPDTVTKLGDEAFSNCTSLSFLDFGKSIGSIGTSAFSNCVVLGSVTLPDTLTSIGPSAFYGCAGLKELTVPASLNTVVSNDTPAFEGCVSIEKISFIGSGDWYDYGSSGSDASYCGYTPWQLSRSVLKNVVISDGVNSVGNSAFEGCTLLASVSLPDSVTKIGDEAFSNCTSLSTLDLGSSVESIGNSAFSNCTSISALDLGKSLRSIGNSAFYYCGALGSVTLPDTVTTLGDEAFSNCISLTFLDLGKSIESIGNSAFYNCGALGSVTLPDTVTSIGISAFCGCVSLKELAVPASLNTVVSNDSPAFEGCVSIEKISFIGSGEWYDYGSSGSDASYYGYTPWQLSKFVLKRIVISDGVKSIGNSAFKDCILPTSISLPDSVTNIGDEAFSNCAYISSLDLGRSLRSIGNSAFSNCVALWSATLPDTVTSIGISAFCGCISLKELAVPASLNTVVSNEHPAFEGCVDIEKISLTGSGKGYDYGSSGSDASYCGYTPWQLSRSVLKWIIISDGVKSVGNSTFKDCTLPTSVSLPDSVTKIGDEAFSNCTSLSLLDLGRHLRSIGNSAFYNCGALCSANLPDTVTSIGPSAFYGCTDLKELTIPVSLNTVVSNEHPAFEGCFNIEKFTFTAGAGCGYDYGSFGSEASNCGYTPWHLSRSAMKNVTISDGVKSIGNLTFKDCTTLVSISLPDSVTKIGDEAFSNCTSLSLLDLGRSLRSIGNSAFYNCATLGSVSLPDTVTTIGTSAFCGCTGLKELTVPASLNTVVSNQHPAFEGCVNIEKISFIGSSDWYAYGATGSDPSYLAYAPWKLSIAALKEAIIADGVKSIGDSAFSDCSKLSAVSLGNSLISIGKGAFDHCTSLLSVIIPSTVASIGANAFYGCISIASLTILGADTSIGGCAFSNCTSLKELTVPVSVDCVGPTYSPAFSDTVNIEKITFSGGTGEWAFKNRGEDVPWMTSKAPSIAFVFEDGVNTIGYQAFKGCTKLTTLSLPDTVTSIGSSAFEGCVNLTAIETFGALEDHAFKGCTFLTSVTLKNCRSIGEYAFEGCIALESLTLPDTVFTIGSYAFMNCTDLTSIDAFGTLKDHVFYGCTSLTSVTVSSVLGTIGEYAFQGCTALTSVILVKTWFIYRYAFQGCIALESLTLPDTVELIGSHAFESCTSLVKIEAFGSLKDRVFQGCTSLTSVTLGNCGSIGEYAFDGCKSLGSLILPDSLETIAEGLFYNCTSLAELTIPENVRSIGSLAFENCTGLTEMTVPNKVKSIGGSAFRNCTHLKEVTVPVSVDCVGSSYSPVFCNNFFVEKITFTPGDGDWNPNNKGKNALWMISSSLQITFIVEGGVKSIGDEAFKGCTKLTSLSLPDTVTSIGSSAFENCVNLTAVEAFGTLGGNAFKGCTSLGSVTLGNALSIGGYAFDGCALIKSFIIPDTVASIGNDAFRNCTSLTSAIFPSSVENIGYEAYLNCTSLGSVTILGDNTSLERRSFMNCRLLTELTVPISVDCARSDESPFVGCFYLMKLTFTAGSGVWNPGNNSDTAPWKISTVLTTVVIEEGVGSLGGGSLFENCLALRYLSLWVGFDSVGSNSAPTFYGCADIEKITFTGPGSWYAYGERESDGSYYGYTPWHLSRSVLKTVVISDGIESVGNYAFSDCQSLSSLTVSDTVTSIGKSAFKGCTGLKNLVIPVGLNCVGSNSASIFSGCTNIETITFTGSGPWYAYGERAYEEPYYGLTPWQLSRSVLKTVVISDGIESVGDNAFKGCTALSELDLADSVLSIGSSAFEGCTSITALKFSDPSMSIGDNAFKGCQSLSSLIISDTLGSIGMFAFRGCIGLKSLTVPVGMNCVGSNDAPIFSGCTNIETVTFVGSGPWYSCKEHTYEEPYYGYTPWQFSNGTLTKIVIPDGVTTVGDYAFSYCTKLVSAELPDSITEVGQLAFANCRSLEMDSVPGSLKVIGDQAFYRCAKIGSVALSSADVSIGVEAFFSCNSLVSVIIEGSATIGNGAFKNCKSLSSVDLGKTKIIGNYAFCACTSITSLCIPDSVTRIGICAFQRCESLTDVVIPDSVESIGASAFLYCSSLESADIGKCLAKIDAGVFGYCTSLTTVALWRSNTLHPDAFVGSDGVNIVIKDYLYTITFMNGDTVLQELELPYGTVPEYGGAEPTKESTDHCTYKFKGWSPGIVKVAGDTVYTAEFTEIYRDYTITFMNGGTVLQISKVPHGTLPEYTGDTPTKESTATQYAYKFIGWSPVLTEAVGDAVYTAEFVEALREYTVTFMNGGTVLQESSVPYGTLPEYTEDTPTKESTPEYAYVFKGWSPMVTPATENVVYEAEFTESLRYYKATFMNGGEDLLSLTLPYGAVPEYEGKTPVREATAQYTFEFKGWDRGFVAIDGDTVYNAVFKETLRKYIITFVNDEEPFLVLQFRYGETPYCPGDNPYREPTAHYTYTFKGWSPEIVPVTGSTTYYAEFTEVPKNYTVKFVNGEETLQTLSVPYGDTPVYTGPTPARAGSDGHTYTFAGWSPEIVPVAGDTAYSAVFADYDWSDNTLTVEADGYDTVTVDRDAIGKIDTDGGNVRSLAVRLSSGTVTLGPQAVSGINGNLGFSVIGGSQYAISAGAQKIIGDRPVYDISAFSDDGNIHRFAGNLTISVKYELRDGEDAEKICIVYLGEHSIYGILDAEYSDGYVTFVTNHLSSYAVALKEDNNHVITFMNGGTTLQVSFPSDGEVPEYTGDEPTREPTARYTYVFRGWDREIVAVTEDAVYNAVFDEIPREYTITFKNGETVLQVSKILYGETPAYSGEAPVREATAQYAYEFKGWSPEIIEVAGNATYIAEFTETLRNYTVAFTNGEEIILKLTLPYGAVPEYEGETPVKEATAQYAYEFKGWSPEIVGVTDDAVYNAEFTETLRYYTVRFVNGEEVLQTLTVSYGDAPAYTGPTPAKTGSDRHVYLFAGWGPRIVPVAGESTYSAVFADHDGSANTLTVEADGYDAVTVDKDMIGRINSDLADGTVGSLVVRLRAGPITLGPRAASSIVGDSVFSIICESRSSISAGARNLIGDRPVYDISIASDDGNIHQFGGDLIISVKYELRDGEDAKNICILYLKDDGSYSTVDAEYSDGYVTFVTDHLSSYAVAFRGADAPAADTHADMVPLGILAGVIILAVCAVGWRYSNRKH